jgi:hypothetical protein
VQVQRGAAYVALEVARAHGALLQESGREAAFTEGGESADGVVAEHENSGGEVNLECGRLQGESTSKGLAPDLVSHVLRVGQGPDDDLSSSVALCRILRVPIAT